MAVGGVTVINTKPAKVCALFSLLRRRAPLSVSVFRRTSRTNIKVPCDSRRGSGVVLTGVTDVRVPPVGYACLR